jgi:hypothetical protein
MITTAVITTGLSHSAERERDQSEYVLPEDGVEHSLREFVFFNKRQDDR